MSADKNAPVQECPVRPCVGSGCINYKECEAKKRKGHK
jgi:hypothetical protein